MAVFTLAKSNDQFESVEDEETKQIIGRLKKDTDLLNGIMNVCRAYSITAGSFQCIGSLAGVGFMQFEQKEDGTLKYAEPTIQHEPVELLAGTGFIGLDEQEELDIHYHGMFLDKRGHISGGHFISEKNPVAITIEFIIHPATNAYMKKAPDPDYHIPIFGFSKRG